MKSVFCFFIENVTRLLSARHIEHVTRLHPHEFQIFQHFLKVSAVIPAKLKAAVTHHEKVQPATVFVKHRICQRCRLLVAVTETYIAVRMCLLLGRMAFPHAVLNQGADQQ
jgi:hypothetical protein